MLTGLIGALVARPGFAQSIDIEDDLRNLRLLDIREGEHRFTLVIPKYQQPDQRIPLLVCLHGLGETGNERMGAYAFFERYGTGRAWQRLKRPPIERTSKRGEWTDDRLAAVNAELEARPFKGFAIACPHMPMPEGPPFHDAYAKWIRERLIPRIRKEVRTIEEPERTYLCGVSLGGYVSLEVLVRSPEVFGAWAGIQTAIANGTAGLYAERLGVAWQGKNKPILALSSTNDTWKSSSEALVAGLNAKKIPSTYRVIPGPHDQPWLQEAGMLEALHWFDRLSP